MATFDLSDTSRRAQATGDGSNVTFPFSFQVNATSDVKVYVGGTLKTLSTHYTIVDSSNAAGLNTNGTGTVKFITSPTDYTPANGDVVTILSDVPVERTSVYTSGGNITAAALESDFDTQAMMLGDREERETRTVMAPVNDPTDVNMVLPAKADRLGKALGFNSSTGNPEAVSFYDSAADVRAAVEAASDSNVFTDADHSKLDGIDDGAEVTSALKVQAAGALMDAELVSETHVKEINQSLKTSATPTFAAISSGGNISVAGLVDGRDVAADGLKLDGIEANATADQTAAEIRTLVESASDSNVFTDADHSKLNAIEANATADQTASEIKTAYESNSDTNAFTDAEKTKLSGVAASANNYVHPNHSGEVSSTSDGVTVIADNVVDEANLKVSNSPTDGYVLTARSGNTGGMTWEAASGGGSAMQTTGGTFTGDVTFEGAQYTNRNVVWDKSDSALEFADNAKIVLGQQSDLQIYHNAQDSYIQANISGNLYLRNATDDFDVVIQSDSGAGGLSDYFRADGSTGEAKLFHYGSEKLKTQSGGVDVTGTVTATSFSGDGANLTNVQAASVNVTESSDDNVDYNILFSDTANSGTVQMTPTQDDNGLTFNPSTNRLYSQYGQHEQVGIDSYLYHNGDTNTWLRFDTNDSIKLGTNGYARLHITNSGVDITGDITVSGTVDGRDIATNIPSSLGTAGQVLTVNSGASAAEWADASGGGGGADLYAADTTSSTNPTASGNRSVAIGSGATASATEATAIGYQATGSGTFSFSAGSGSISAGSSSSAVGYAAYSNAASSAAFGRNARAYGEYSTALSKSYANGADSFAAAITNNTSSYGSSGANSIALGDRSKSTGSRGIAIGGYGALASGTSSLAFGYQATANQNYASGFGYASKAYGAYSFAGTESHASGSNSVALGLGDTSTSYGALHDNGVALGYQATTSAAKQIALGSSTAQVKVSGAYTLPTADGSANQVLTAAGDGTTSWAAASGGGGDPDLYKDNASSTAVTPTASGTNAVALGSGAVASGNLSFAFGSSGTNAAISSGAQSISMGSYSRAYASTSIAMGYSAEANSNASGGVAIGQNSRSAGSYAVALGQSYASGVDAFAAAIGNNSSGYGAKGNYSVAMGETALTQSNFQVAIGHGATGGSVSNNAIALGQSYVSGSDSLSAAIVTNSSSYGASGAKSRAIGEYSKASANNSTALGYIALASAQYSMALGHNSTASAMYAHANGYQALADEYGECVWANGKFANQGDAQTGKVVLRGASSSASVLTLGANGSATTWPISDNSAYTFTAMFVARRKASEGTESAAVRFEGLLRKEGNDASVTLVNSTKTVISNAPNWTISIAGSAGAAGENNGGLDVIFYDSNGWNVRCVCTIEYTKVTYA